MSALSGRVAVVTGGGQGIGLGISLALRAAGAEILVAQRSPLPQELAQARWIEADLAQAQNHAAIAEAALRHFGRVDILVNNAGIMFEKALDDMDYDDWNRMLAVNLTAPVFLSKHLLPLMRAGQGASIINIGSIEGLAANPAHAAYCATKGGIHALTRAMAVDLGNDGIRVNAIAPGWIRTDLSNDYINAQPDAESAWQGLFKMHPLGRIGEPEDVGKLAVFLGGDDAAFITGQVIVIDGGRTSKLPLPF
ncbi:MAG: glucose 1-dehydrogenase [Gammaproteobacteria bacterium]|nr:glucose 1-dehydrogenase [Gammaproteobacteria bacterium]